MNTPDLHRRLLALAVAQMSAQGIANIKAHEIQGYSQPDLIGGYRPDATGAYQNRLVILEAETTQGLSATHTREQLQAFYGYARSVNGWLILAVCEPDKKAAQLLLGDAEGRSAFVWTL